MVDSLGIRKLHAVVGASMGGLQAYEWGESNPDGVDRIVAVVASANADPYLIAWLDMWAQSIRLDPNWNNGDYYGKEPPTDGLKAALKLVTLQANGWEWARAAVADANHFLYLCRANQLAAADPAKIRVPALVLYAPNDLIFYEPIVQETIQKIAAAGGSVESDTLIGPNGHIDAFTAIGPKAAEITAFLAK